MFELFKKKNFEEKISEETEKNDDSFEGRSMIELAGEGDRFYFGKDGYPVDKVKAFSFFEKSAQMGNLYGMIMAGYMLDFGDGIKRDPKMAVKWYTEAAEMGDANACLNLANMYLLGRGIIPDTAKGIFWLRKSAEAGNAIAASSLGRQYTLGEGVEESLSQAEYWISKAEEGGYINCGTMTNLGLMYDAIDDYKKAFICFEKAVNADPDDDNTQYLYGQYKFFGKGTKIDVPDAQSRIQRVVDNNPRDADAQILLRQILLYNHLTTGLDVIQSAISNQSYIWDYTFQIIAVDWGYRLIIQFCTSKHKPFMKTSYWPEFCRYFSNYTGTAIEPKEEQFVYEAVIKLPSEQDLNFQRLGNVISLINKAYNNLNFECYGNYYVLRWRT